MTEQCKNCGHSSWFPGGYHCFNIKEHVENESICESWIPRKMPTKEEIGYIRSISELSLAMRDL